MSNKVKEALILGVDLKEKHVNKIWVLWTHAQQTTVHFMYLPINMTLLFLLLLNVIYDRRCMSHEVIFYRCVVRITRLRSFIIKKIFIINTDPTYQNRVISDLVRDTKTASFGWKISHFITCIITLLELLNDILYNSSW